MAVSRRFDTELEQFSKNLHISTKRKLNGDLIHKNHMKLLLHCCLQDFESRYVSSSPNASFDYYSIAHGRKITIRIVSSESYPFHPPFVYLEFGTGFSSSPPEQKPTLADAEETKEPGPPPTSRRRPPAPLNNRFPYMFNFRKAFLAKYFSATEIMTVPNLQRCCLCCVNKINNWSPSFTLIDILLEAITETEFHMKLVNRIMLKNIFMEKMGFFDRHFYQFI